ncbi:MAG: hypothetical protein ACE5R6_16960 [Candidatus Heimdallarchaeota archaeon]
MKMLTVPKPFSAGILLSYKCTNECKHCMYACSPHWNADWLAESDAEQILTQLARSIEGSPWGGEKVGVNYGVHFTGGEPFLNFNLLLNLTEIAQSLQIPSTFTETNCYWCTRDDQVKDRFKQLKAKGLKGILLSANPFTVEQIPFERIERAIKIGKEIFGENVMVYNNLFFTQLRILNIKQTLSFRDYLSLMKKKNPLGLQYGLSYPSIFPMARVPYKLGHLYRKYPPKTLFGESCIDELKRPWHIHIDNYGNYIPGYCAGISLGNATNLNSINQINLEDYPILNALTTDIEALYHIGIKEFEYEERSKGYISKCHLCVDIRKYITQKTTKLKELRPLEFYSHLE